MRALPTSFPQLFIVLMISVLALSSPARTLAQDEPATGTIGVMAFACTGLESPEIFTGSLADERRSELGCEQTITNVSFYLYGDGTDDSIPMLVDEMVGPTFIAVPAGSYAVVDDLTGVQVDVDIPAGANDGLILTSLHPGEPLVETPIPTESPTTGEGVVNVVTMSCPNSDYTTYVLNPGDPGALPTMGSDCTLVTDYAFHVTSADGWFTLQTGVPTNVPAGDYVLHAPSGPGAVIDVPFTVVADSAVQTSMLQVVPETGFLNLYTWNCTDAQEPDLVIADDSVPGAGCTRTDGSFSLYLYGDGSDEPVALGEISSLEVPVGTYAVVDEETGLQLDVEVHLQTLVSVAAIHSESGVTTPQPTTTPVATTAPAAVTGLPRTGAEPGIPEGESIAIGVGVVAVGAILICGIALVMNHRRS